MSETPQEKLCELMIAALRHASSFLDLNDPLHRKIVDSTLTAQMRDPAAVDRLIRAITAHRDNPPGVPLSTAERMERLRLVPKISVPVREDQPRAQAAGPDTAARVQGFEHNYPLDHGRCGHGLAVLYNLAVGYARHVGGDTDYCPSPETIRATVQSSTIGSTIATDVNVSCARCGQSLLDDNCPDECPCATVDDATVADRDDTHKGDYGVADTPPLTPGRYGHEPPSWANRVRSPEEIADVPAAERTPDERYAYGTDGPWPGAPIEVVDVATRVRPFVDAATRNRTDPTAPVPPGMQAQPDGDTRDWPSEHEGDCYDRDCTGCKAIG